MPFGVLGTYACRDLQTTLVNFFGSNAAQYRTLGDVSLIKWLLSPQNTSGFQRIDVKTIPGKKRGVAFMTDDPYCFELCSLSRVCTTPPTLVAPASGEIVFDLSDDPWRHCDGSGNPVALKFDYEDLMKYCTIDDTTWITNQISRYLLRWEEALDKVLAEKLIAGVGTNAAGAALTSVPIFINNTTMNSAVLNPEGIWYLEQLMKDIGSKTQFSMIGGQIINKIAQFKAWATMNNAGVDLSKANDLIPYLFYDRNFDTLLGMKDFLEIMPGTAQIVTWNKYAGSMRKTVTDLYTHGQITLPTTGLTLDYEWTYDYNCKIWRFEAFLYIELAIVPAGGCGDNSAGINGIVRVTDCGTTSVVPPCPELPIGG